MRALVVRLSSIGDVVHTLPALAALNHNGWEAGWLVEPLARPLLVGSLHLLQLTTAPPARAFHLRAAWETVKTLREHAYDVALDFQGLWKSAAWGRLSRAKRLVGFERGGRREPASSLLLGESARLAADAVHVIDKNLALLRPLGIEAVGLREFPFPPVIGATHRVKAALEGLGPGDVVVLNPGGGWANKLWPPEGYAQIARALRDRGLRSLVTWGPGEQALADRVVELSGRAAIRSFPTSLTELLALLRRARLVVAADTGPLHMACAVRTPVVGLYGPTDPARNGPFAEADVVVRAKPPCAPCHRRRCPVHEGVMNQITAGEVLQAIDRRLARSARTKGVAV